MTSPFVRRRRLATELRTLREARGLTAGRLADLIHHSRMKISRLENAKVRPEVAEVIKILDVLDVTDDKWKEIVRIACDAAERGWWDNYGDAMGSRQRLYADIESGAKTIREYNQTVMPGILQTTQFITALVDLTEAEGALDFVPEKMTEARLHRQRAIFRSSGPTYEVILDETVIRRLTVPAEVMAAQLRHIVEVLSTQPRLTVRVLPVDARIGGRTLPRTTFTLYMFPDPDDPPMAVVDTINTDIVHTKPGEVERYERSYEHLSRAALSPDDTVALLTEVAKRTTS
ncbi:helix-turn-helix transcriptional regulator [Actinomadura miaoliensis]|uniref:Helix-turn-helix transcriptional regulator n=1 Tax=Actinomadura miaoliensis TaxID=430685 RepID=A0ABP7W548_9ACTN